MIKFKANDYKKGDIIRIFRECEDMTQKEFGKEISKSRETIKHYESNEVNYTIETLLKIARKYNKSVAQICLKWCLQNNIIPLPKSENIESCRFSYYS